MDLIKVNLINLTPHPVVIDGVGVLPPSGAVARVATVSLELEEFAIEAAGLGRVPLALTRFGQIEDLPEPAEGVMYVTSALVAQAAWAVGRRDVIAPDTSPSSAVRDGDGRIIAVRRLHFVAS